MDEQQNYTLYWRDGKVDKVIGRDIADAMNRAGYSGGAIAALDFFSCGWTQSYFWNKDAAEWLARPNP